ncbi:MAG: ABC transporter permease [Bacteroidales bacterium]|nr:ABC transporter permease [Bacteroidales bacterium]
MNFPFFIARRYLLAKKSHNLINVITAVSVAGVAIGAFALIVTLSAINGFKQVILQMVNVVAPDLVIEPVKGKTFVPDNFPYSDLTGLKAVKAVAEVLEEDALFRYGENQHLGRVKGVSFEYQKYGLIDESVVEGQFLLEQDDIPFAVAGSGVGWYLGLNLRHHSEQLLVYMPRVGSGQVFSLDQGFSSRPISVSGIFSSQPDLDARYVYVPLSWMQDLSDQKGRISGIELFLEKPNQAGSIMAKLTHDLGPEFVVKDRIRQQATLYQIMRSEKAAVFVILSFILIMATFNIIGSLTMLMIDKQKDSSVLKSFGASDHLIRRIFLSEGMLIAVAGGLSGLASGIILVVAQQKFGLLKLGGGSGTFIIDAYPVQLLASDVLLVFLLVLLIGGASTIYTVWQTMRKRKSVSLVRDL